MSSFGWWCIKSRREKENVLSGGDEGILSPEGKYILGSSSIGIHLEATWPPLTPFHAELRWMYLKLPLDDGATHLVKILSFSTFLWHYFANQCVYTGFYMPDQHKSLYLREMEGKWKMHNLEKWPKFKLVKESPRLFKPSPNNTVCHHNKPITKRLIYRSGAKICWFNNCCFDSPHIWHLTEEWQEERHCWKKSLLKSCWQLGAKHWYLFFIETQINVLLKKKKTKPLVNLNKRWKDSDCVNGNLCSELKATFQHWMPLIFGQQSTKTDMQKKFCLCWKIH